MEGLLVVAKAAILAADDGKVFGQLPKKEQEKYIDKVVEANILSRIWKP